MPDNKFSLQTNMHAIYDKVGLSAVAKNKKIIVQFAKKHNLVFFSTPAYTSAYSSLSKSVMNVTGQRDNNICIGAHDGYDMVFLQRHTTIRYPGHDDMSKQWNIMQFDLHSHSDLPFLFIGTKQQSRTFYARLFQIKREVRHIDPQFYTSTPRFSSHFSVVASPAEQVFITQLLTQTITEMMAKHKLPFAIEVQDDSLFVITENIHTTTESLTRMMHYGLWLARHIDSI